MKWTSPGSAENKVKVIERIVELVNQCVSTAGEVSDVQKLKRIEQISEWCENVSQTLADDKHATCQEADYVDEIASMALELSEDF